jgi:hypothetical protein
MTRIVRGVNLRNVTVFVVKGFVTGGGRNDPNIVCTYELKKKKSFMT